MYLSDDSLQATAYARQEAARHTDPKLTISTYTRFGLVDLGGAVQKLPSLPSTESTESIAKPVVATGTDNASIEHQQIHQQLQHDSVRNGAKRCET